MVKMRIVVFTWMTVGMCLAGVGWRDFVVLQRDIMVDEDLICKLCAVPCVKKTAVGYTGGEV